MTSPIAKAKQQSRTTVKEETSIDSVTKYSVSVMGGVSALVGLWAAVCFIAAMVGSGGPLDLAQSWFRAISGM